MKKFNFNQFEQNDRYLLFLREHGCDGESPRIIQVSNYQTAIGDTLVIQCPELFPDTILVGTDAEVRDKHGSLLADLYMTDRAEWASVIQLDRDSEKNAPIDISNVLLFDGFGLATQTNDNDVKQYVKLTYPLLSVLNADPELRLQINERRYGNRLLRDFTILFSDAAACFAQPETIDRQCYEQLYYQSLEELLPPEEPKKVMVSFSDLAEQAFALAPGDGIDFSCQQKDSYNWNLTKINQLETDMIVMGIYGGRETYLHDLTGQDEPDDLASFIHRSLAAHTKRFVYLDQQRPTRYYTPGELYSLIETELNAKYLLVYRNEKDMIRALDGKVYAISNADGTYLCDVLEEDYVRLLDEGTIINKSEAPDGIPYYSDWIVADYEYRQKVLGCRVAILFLEK